MAMRVERNHPITSPDLRQIYFRNANPNFGTAGGGGRWATMRPRTGMPLITYFAVVVPALVGLLFLADAELGPPPPLKLSRESVLSLEKPKVRSIQILTVNESRWVAPDLAPAEAMAQAAPSPAEPLKKTAKAASVHKKKVARAPEPHEQAPSNRYAAYAPARRDVW